MTTRALVRMVELGDMRPRTAAKLVLMRVELEQLLARLWLRGLARAVARRWRR